MDKGPHLFRVVDPPGLKVGRRLGISQPAKKPLWSRLVPRPRTKGSLVPGGGLDSGQKAPLLTRFHPGLKTLWSRVVAPTGTKAPHPPYCEHKVDMFPCSSSLMMSDCQRTSISG